VFIFQDFIVDTFHDITIGKCVLINGFPHCACCRGFPCSELNEAHSLQKINNREEYIRNRNREISEDDYKVFIEPYTGLSHLNTIRLSIPKKDLKDFKKFNQKTKVTPFVHDEMNEAILLTLYSVMSSLCIERDISYARNQTLERKREDLMNLLWAAGSFGILPMDKDYLELNSQTYTSLKIGGMYERLLEQLSDLKKYDIQGEVIPLVEKGWLTPMGGLRKEGWVFRLKFGESLGGTKGLRVFRDYVQKLKIRR